MPRHLACLIARLVVKPFMPMRGLRSVRMTIVLISLIRIVPILGLARLTKLQVRLPRVLRLAQHLLLQICPRKPLPVLVKQPRYQA